ncbi:MAG: LysR family transcriptional regulator [Acidimicrobiia bacterium]
MYGDAIKVTQLHYVRAAADLGSFSRAAASLGVTQPALSNGIAALEHILGGPLFERSTTGVVVTPLAVRILPHLDALLASLDALLAEARAAAGQDAEPLRMGVSPLIHPELVARAFQAARQHAPAALILKEDNLADLQTALLARQLDVILVPSVTDATGCQRRRIDAEPLHYLPGTDQAAVASTPAMLATSAHTNGQPIELTELSGQPLVMVGEACGLTTFTRTLFATTGAQLRSYPGEADSYRSLEDWANLGLGGALMPASRFRTDTPTRPVHDHGHPITISYEALWLTHTPRKQAIETLLDTVLSST